jgi:hypothetical protein
MRNYVTARAFTNAVEILGWLGIVVGLASGAMAFGRGLVEAMMVMLPIIVPSVAMITVAQLGRAQIDTAENTGKLVALMDRLVSDVRASPLSDRPEKPSRP